MHTSCSRVCTENYYVPASMHQLSHFRSGPGIEPGTCEMGSKYSPVSLLIQAILYENMLRWRETAHIFGKSLTNHRQEITELAT